MRRREEISLRTLVDDGPIRVSRGTAERVIEMGHGTAWRLRPPASPEWPEDHWAYAVGPEGASEKEVVEAVGHRYLGDWSPTQSRWVVERLKNPLTPAQRRRLLEKAETGRMMFEAEDEDEDSPRAGQTKRQLTQLPPGTRIRRLPPGVAEGAMPFDWPVSNPSAPAEIRVYTVTPKRTWSIVDAKTGMEIALVTGKRRRDALLSHLRHGGTGTWQQLRERAFMWKTKHPLRKGQ